MQTEELVSQAEYKRRYKIGDKTLKQMIYNKELELRGKKIVIKNNDVVSREVYENEKERRIIAEQKLKIIENRLVFMLKEVR